ncbi:MAG: prolyl-tRNA synthetase associated domain-containing protein [Patescibacteria group bacterium]|jgi:Ala-tRNA(Pro) deacylase
MKDIYSILNRLEIKYKKYEHPAVFTVEEAKKHDTGNGSYNKSIFLRNQKETNFYLVLTLGSKKLDLKGLAVFLNDSKLSFASPEKMMKYLGLTPGSVSPFGLINDVDKVVQVIVDEELLKFDKQGYHPNINTATLIISTEDLKKFLNWTKNKVTYKSL